MSGDRSEDDGTEEPPEDQPRDEPHGGERDPPPEEPREPRGGENRRPPADDRPPAEEPPRDEPRGGRRDPPRGGGRQPRRGGPSATDVLKRQENMTLLKTWAALYTLIGLVVAIGAVLVYNIGGQSVTVAGQTVSSTGSPFGTAMVGGVLAFGPLLAVVVGREIRDSLDQDDRSLYITSAATNGLGALGMGLLGGLLGLAGSSGTAVGALVGAILMALLSAGVGAGTIWVSDWAERSSQPRRRPAGGRQREPEPRGEPRDDRQPR